MTEEATLILPNYISHGMVVQREKPILIKGKDLAGKNMNLTFDQETINTTADMTGSWTVSFSPRKAGGPYTLSIEGTSQRVVEDIYVGEVWLLGGQSNMEMLIERSYDEFKEEIDAADFPLIRQFKLEMAPAFDEPEEGLSQGKWKTATQKYIQDFSSLGFFYAKMIHENLRVPIGIYQTAIGGTPIEAWMSENTLHELEDYDEEIEYWKNPHHVEKAIETDLEVNQNWYQDLYENDHGSTDTPKWMEENKDTANWTSIDLPVMFKETELAGVSGVVWFRKTFEITDNQLESDFIRLRLGSLIDGDETYLNGRKVGETDHRYPPRKYVLEKEDLKLGTNTLVIRLVIDAGNGGFIPDFPYQVELDEQNISLEGEWVYRIGYQKNPIAPALNLHYKPAVLYKGMLFPLKDVRFRGALFYQGESNTKEPAGYNELMKRMVSDWRGLFGDELSFYYVQLANYFDPAVDEDDRTWAEIRYEQDRARFMISRSEMVPAYDCGISNELHPYDKKTLAERLAQVALSSDYEAEENYTNLEIDDVMISEDLITLKVKGLKGDLAATDKKPLLELKINGEWIIVREIAFYGENVYCRIDDVFESTDITEVRYAWKNDPQGYIYDLSTKLPLLPFTFPL